VFVIDVNREQSKSHVRRVVYSVTNALAKRAPVILLSVRLQPT
jgi:hypothetical protein